MFKKLVVILAFCLPNIVHSYEFYGNHFMASYKECDHEALIAIDNLLHALEQAIKLSGATILESSHSVFPGDGLTAVFLLSESHASIHTYPEHNACFVDLFTCGHDCSYIKFDQALEAYLKPKLVDKKEHIRI